MTTYSLNYHSYTISGDAAKKKCQYQSPEWPNDPRIVRAPSLDTAKRWIREECRRREHFPNGREVYLLKSWLATTRCDVWRIVNAQKEDLVQPWFGSPVQAREFAYYRGWVLLEHFNY